MVEKKFSCDWEHKCSSAAVASSSLLLCRLETWPHLKLTLFLDRHLTLLMFSPEGFHQW